MPSAYSIAIDPQGAVIVIYDDAHAELLDAGVTTVTRVSNVEPLPAGGWIADMSPSGYPVKLGPYKLRSEALTAEVQFLESQLF